MTDAPDIVDVFIGTPMGTSDHCFVSCELRVEQSVPENNVRHTFFFSGIVPTGTKSTVQTGALHGAPF